MSAQGHSRRFSHVRVKSALPPIAGELAHCGQPRDVPKPDIAVSLFLRQRHCNFAGSVDEKLRNRAERSALQGDDADRHGSNRQIDGKTFSTGPSATNRNAEAGKIVRKRPIARRLARTSLGSVTTVTRG